MNPVELIKQGREKKGWTQKQLADAIGVTSGFVTKVETEQSLPSYEICVAMARALDLPLEKLWSGIESARTEALQQRIKTRGAAVRGAIRTRGAAVRKPARSEQQLDVAEIAREIAADADGQAALRDLRIALADPQMRPAVLAALAGFARAARSEPRE